MQSKETGLEVAIIGVSGRFPGSKNIDLFWKNLTDGAEFTSVFPKTNGEKQDIESNGSNQEVKAAALLEDIELFDASFFGLNPREAELMDPQHRLFLEHAWEALEDAGYDSQREERPIGVYAGVGASTYLLYNLFPNNLKETLGYFPVLLASDKDYVPTRVSYKLNLTGPSLSVGTACSSSLVAVHLAYQSLLSGDCDMALAAGVSVKAPQNEATLCPEGISPDGHCFAFDARANGTIGGNGIGVVVLKRLEDAITDRDYIYAVIKGSAINNDGAVKVSYTAPSEEAQAKVIRTAQIMAEVEPETISYIETHGTGTSMGDPIEFAGLKQAFSTDKKSYCAIGSVKTNIGHLDAAAGIAGLIKTTLALENKLIPPSLNFETPNPQIDFENSPFYLNTKLSEWQANGTPRRAGVSSFGFGGTNAHVVLEEAPPNQPSATSRRWQLLLLSAKTSSALDTATANLVEHLKQHPEIDLADAAYTLQVGRREFDHRRAVVCQDIEDAISAFTDPKRVLSSIQEKDERHIAFMFTGLGTHYVNMAWELYQDEPVFREQVDKCCQLLKPLLELDLRDILYPNRNQASEAFQPPNSASDKPSSGLDLRKMLGRDQQPADEATEKLNQTYLTQPAIFVIEYALAQLWMSWGIRPVAMIGYSIGEYVAATLAGVLSIEDALTLVAKRAQMIQQLPAGAMLAVPLSEEEVHPLLSDKLSLSAINGAKLCVIAGDTDAVEQLADQLTEKGLACRRLQTSHAFHSQMMEPISSSLTELVKTVSLKPPQIPYLSNVTGTWITPAEATDPSYWTKHMCQPVRFADGVNELWKQQKPILLEVGPGQTLSSLALQCLESKQVADKVVLPSLRDAYNQHSDLVFLLNTLGQLWLSGVGINWSGFYTNEHRYRIPLPTYPFERQRYWVEPSKLGHTIPTGQNSLEKKPDITDWFYIPVWKKSMPPVPFEMGTLKERTSCWLLFVDECGVGLHIAQRLKDESQDVISVRVGEQFSRLSQGEYTINPRQPDDYSALLKDLCARDKLPNTIVHSWNLKLDEQAQLGIELFEQAQNLGFYSLLFLTQALGKQIITDPLQLWVLSNGMHEVESADVLSPEKATVLGLCNVIPQEYPNITCRSIDLVLPQPGTQQEEKLINQILTELTTPSFDLTIAYRGNHRWLQDFESVRLDNKTQGRTRLRQGGVYLITGGLGKLGLILGKHLAQRVQPKLVLIGRSGLPAKEEWEQWLATHDQQERVSIRIKKVQELEELGAEVLVISADVTNQAQMQAAITQTEELFGKIHGVIHAAGVVDKESLTAISETGYPECELHFQPKVYGVYTLEKVLQGRKLDYCLLISSVSSILGGLGFAAYSSANIFLDAFAHKQNQLNDNNWCSSDWFLVDVPEEIAEAFERVLSKGTLPQIVISQLDLKTQINKWIKRQSRLDKEEDANGQVESSLHLRPNLRNAFVAPSSETEHRIAKRYQELLGIEQVGIHDSFFELGGNSLIGTQMISQLRQDFNLEIPINILFEAPTVAELVLAIEKIFIGKLEALTEEEVQELVSDIASK
ncbi:MAG: SDR family oxidoreductase [Symploca sp. SIO2E9]|nr:SDR family oxidoreductase [Symploca sp. SIO2E9]